MSLVLNEDQQILREAAKTFIADNTPVDAFRKLRDAGETHNPQLWEQMVELGWPAIAVPEQYEGLEFGLTGLGLLVIEAGRHLVASPLASTAGIGVTALVLGTSDDARQRILPRIASGDALVALAVDEQSHHDISQVTTIARRSNAGLVLNGKKVFVAEGRYADYFLVVARDDDERMMLLLVDTNAEGVTRDAVHLMDSRDYANVTFENVAVLEADILARGEDAERVTQTVADVATILAACELYGLSQQVFDSTVQYLTEREQFGKPIGSFQALQHRAAHAFTQIQLLKSVILDALEAAAKNREDLGLATSHAKAFANDTAQIVTNESIQMHGGIGVTDELDIGLYLKRARTLRNAYGSSSYHRGRFAQMNGY